MTMGAKVALNTHFFASGLVNRSSWNLQGHSYNPGANAAVVGGQDPRSLEINNLRGIP